MQDLRKQFPVFEQYTYLNTASSGILSTPLAERRRELDEKFLEGGSVFRNSVYEDMDAVKATVSNTFNCPQNRISLVPNCSFGLNAVLESLAKGQKVLMLEYDYPSLVWPFQSRDFDCMQIPQEGLNEESLMESIRKYQPWVLAVSIVQWQNGQVITPFFLKQLKKHFPEMLIIVDGTQFLGTAPFDFEDSGIDLFLASTYKWLCAGYGNGVLFFSEQLDAQLRPKTTGYNTYRRASKSNGAPTALHFEPGHQDYLAFESLKFSVEYFNTIGFENIQSRIKELMTYAIAQLKDNGYKLNTIIHPLHYSGIISFEGSPEMAHYLEANDIICSYRNGIRISLHAYNQEVDIDQLLFVLQKYN